MSPLQGGGGLSAEPLVGLKLRCRPTVAVQSVLSAEPLVGLKQAISFCQSRVYVLSAEPLVGLKLDKQRVLTCGYAAFSRTPRGFEARSAAQLPITSVDKALSQ